MASWLALYRLVGSTTPPRRTPARQLQRFSTVAIGPAPFFGEY